MTTIKIAGQEYPLALTLGAMEQLDEMCGGIENAAKRALDALDEEGEDKSGGIDDEVHEHGAQAARDHARDGTEERARAKDHRVAEVDVRRAEIDAEIGERHHKSGHHARDGDAHDGAAGLTYLFHKKTPPKEYFSTKYSFESEKTPARTSGG